MGAEPREVLVGSTGARAIKRLRQPRLGRLLAALDDLEHGTLTVPLLPVPECEPWQYFQVDDLWVLIYPDENIYCVAEVASRREIERLFKTL